MCCTIIVAHSSFSIRDGQSLTDNEVVGMMIGLLLAGQHTSSTTSAWLGFYLARDKPLQVHSSILCVLYKHDIVLTSV